MSVRKMTTDQLKADLEAIILTWPDGVPEQQQDRVNALRGELKRRGGDEVSMQPRPQASAVDLADLTDAALEKELRRLSGVIERNQKDEAAQERFAEVRYELRKRQKANGESNGNGKEMFGGAVVARTTEMPARRVPRQVDTPQLDTEVFDEMKKEAALQAAVEVTPAQQAVAAKNGMLLEHIETEHKKVQLAQTASIVAARILDANPMVDDSTVEYACEIGLKVARTIFDKVGL